MSPRRLLQYERAVGRAGLRRSVTICARNTYSHLESDDSGFLDHQSEWEIYNPNEAPFMRRRITTIHILRLSGLRTHPERSPIARPIVRRRPPGYLNTWRSRTENSGLFFAVPSSI